MKHRHLLLLLVALLQSFDLANAQQKIPLAVEHTGSDLVGKSLAFDVKEAIRSAAAMKLVEIDSPAPRLVIYLTTLDGDRASPGQSTVSSVALVYDSPELPFLGYFVTAFSQTCGLRRTPDCAKGILASADRAIDRMRKDQPDLLSRLR